MKAVAALLALLALPPVEVPQKMFSECVEDAVTAKNKATDAESDEVIHIKILKKVDKRGWGDEAEGE